MAVKKKAKTKAKPKEKPVGFFERNKDIIPREEPQKSVRVKTFIVEKPIIIHDKPQHINASEGGGEDFDSGRKKYKKVFRGIDLEDDGPANEDGALDAGGEEGDFGAEGEGVGEGEGDISADDDFGEGAEGGEGGLEQQVRARHARSRGMSAGVWWKKAILWAVFVWLIMLALELVMQAIKLVEVDLTRQWWFLLGGLIVVSFIYFGLLEGRLKI